MLVCPVERHRHILQHQQQTHALAVLPSQAPRQGRLAYLYKEWRAHDEDGRVLPGWKHERTSQVTVLKVDEPAIVELVPLPTARDCGYRTLQAFRAAWTTRHPNSPRTVVAWFAVGDWRDTDVFMNWTGRAGGDYTGNRSRALDPDAPVLSRDEIDRLAAQNRQKDDARRARQSRLQDAARASERLRRVLEEADRMGVRKDIRGEARLIDLRLKDTEKR